MSMLKREERLLVCVDYGHTGKRMIRRGGQLAQQLGAPLTILVFDSLDDEEYSLHKQIDIPLFKQLAEQYGAEVIVKKSKAVNITKVIVDTANHVKATHVMIGQVVESVWTALLGRSVIDTLLQQLPNADLHVVPHERANEEDDWSFDNGREAYLIKNSNGTYHMTFDDFNNRAEYKGIFFKSLYTDFENGIFAFRSEDDKIVEVRVKDGIVHSLVDIDAKYDRYIYRNVTSKEEKVMQTT